MLKKTFIFLLYILISSFGLLRLKTSQKILDFDFVTGFSFYGLGFIFWLYILKSNPLSVAFPIASGGLIIATQVVGYLVLREQMSVTQIIGVMSIIIGITLIYFNLGGD